MLVSDNGEIKHHFYVKLQTRICTTWAGFPFACRLLFIISAHKFVVSGIFFFIHNNLLSCFYLLISYFEKFSISIWRLPYTWSLNPLMCLDLKKYKRKSRVKQGWNESFVSLPVPIETLLPPSSSHLPLNYCILLVLILIQLQPKRKQES